MRNAVFFLALGSLVACDVFTPIEKRVQTMEPHSRWETEALKIEYVIQFPEEYIGGWQGDDYDHTFWKTRADEQVVFRYVNCGIERCVDFFGSSSIEGDIRAEDRNYAVITLPNSITFVNDAEEEVGLFFYNTEAASTGVFMMKIEDEYYRFVTVDFTPDDLKEILSILVTIRYQV